MSMKARPDSCSTHRPSESEDLARIGRSSPRAPSEPTDFRRQGVRRRSTGWFERSPLPAAWIRCSALALLLFPAFGCVAAPEPADWLAAGNAPFRTAEGTFGAFKTAVAGDAADLGYRCLSSGFRRRNGIDQLTYRELLDRFPWFRYLARAEILERRESGPDRIEFLCEIDIPFKSTRFAMGFIREDFFDVYEGAEPVGGDLSVFEELAQSVEDSDGTPGIALWVPLPPGRGLRNITEIRVGREWKIDSIDLEPDSASKSL